MKNDKFMTIVYGNNGVLEIQYSIMDALDEDI